MLASEKPGETTSQSKGDSNSDRDLRGLLPRSLRPLHGEVSRTGWTPSHMDQTGRDWHPWKWARHDDREKQHGNWNCIVPVARKNSLEPRRSALGVTLSPADAT